MKKFNYVAYAITRDSVYFVNILLFDVPDGASFNSGVNNLSITELRTFAYGYLHSFFASEPLDFDYAFCDSEECYASFNGTRNFIVALGEKQFKRYSLAMSYDEFKKL